MSTNFSPSPAELALVSQIFTQADPQKLGVLTGDVAVRVFGGAKLAPTVLGEIWSIADEDNKGWLPKRGVAIAVRLMGWAQKGEKVTQALVNKPGPLPTIEGVTVVSQHNTGLSTPKSPPPGFPPLTPQDKAKFQNMFLKSGPTNGLLSGDKARDIFVKSKLPTEKLLQIWDLADTQDRGLLDSTDFAIGMYFIQGLMSNQLSFIPSSLPPGLYQQAGGKSANNQGSVRSHMSGNSGSFSPLGNSFPQNRSHLQAQHTGQNQLLQPDLTGMSASRAPNLPARPNASAFGGSAFGTSGNGHAPQWDVTQAEKTRSDLYFDDLDPNQRGYIEGDVAVPFMLESKLPGEDLALVWDLADINNNGRLTRDGFAVAMHLIKKKLAGTELPSSLPTSLIPPSMRTNGASPFGPAPAPQPEPVHDLFSWDETPSHQPNTSHSQHTGAQSPAFPPPTTARASAHDPFGPSSFQSPGSHQDLLGDDDDIGTSSPHLHDQSAEIGNVQNQLNSTNRSLATTKAERTDLEQALANQAAQLSALQTQLSSAKAAYETETKLLSTLRERHSSQTAEIQKSREELIRAESDLSAVRVEKAEVEGSFLRDKEEARDLQKRVFEVGHQVEALKAEVEKVKKEAKQQKGLLAIARKQASTKEAEKAKTEKELEEAGAELASFTQDRKTAEAELAHGSATALPTGPERGLSSDSASFAASFALPTSPEPTSPATSTLGKSNNPFERLVMTSGNSTPRSQSPFLPFASSSVPTPSAANEAHAEAASDASTNDLFGFSQAFSTDTPVAPSQDIVETSNIEENSGVSTPKIAAAGHALAPNTDSAAPDTPTTASESDRFSTLPTAVQPQPHTTSPPSQNSEVAATARFPALDNAAFGAPVLPVSSMGNNPPGQAQLLETDLSAQLKELDVNESDSGSDDEDEVPLATLAKSKSTDSTSKGVISPNGNGTPARSFPDTSFDDVFGVNPAMAPSPHPLSVDDNKDAYGASVVKPSGLSELVDNLGSPIPNAPVVAGINAFDEAMGKIPPSASAANPEFSFDSAFDDNFDFSSSAEVPPVTTTAPPQAPPEINNFGGFDNIFGTSANSGVSTLPPHEVSKPVAFVQSPAEPVVDAPIKSDVVTSFDETFSGFGPGPSLNIDNSFSPQVHTAQVSQAPPTDPAVSKPFPTPLATSPPRSVRPTSPPPREISPPPRVSSPKPRPSTSSSKEAHEKLKEPPARHSKLSIRLPFGKKKKHSEPLPPPPSNLSPPQEEPSRVITPALEGDAEPVKQLIQMGFSRSQAVVALEKYQYDVQKALNYLLGAP